MKKFSYFLIMFSAALWGTSGFFVMQLLSLGFNQMQIVTIRVLLSALMLFPFIYFKNKQLLYFKIRDIWCFLGTGVISLLFFSFCYFTAMELTSLSIAAVLIYTAPGFVLIFSAILFKEKLTKSKLIALLFIFMGCVMVTGVLSSSSLHISLIGFAFGLCSGIGYALYSIFSRYALNKGYDSLTISLYTFTFASMGGIPFSNVIAISSLCNMKSFLLFIFMSILCCLLPYFLYTRGLENVENGKASMMATIEPVVATIIGVFLFGEKLNFITSLGIICVISGILIVNRKESEPEKEAIEA